MLDAKLDVKRSFLQWLVMEDSQRQDVYRAMREYYNGEHDTQLTARQRRYLQIKFGEEFNNNQCPIVVDSLSERLRVTGFDAGESDATQYWDWWTQNRMDGLQMATHLAAIRDGDTYLVVEYDQENGRPVFTHELAYDGAEGVKVHYSKEKRNLIEFASKRWQIQQGPETGYRRRLNLYFPDHIEKYQSDSRHFEGNWVAYLEDANAEEQEGVLGLCGWLWWTDTSLENGEALGVPVVHFRNRDQGYNYGQSELKNVVPLQNALNKAVVDLLAAADTTAFRMLTAIGFDPANVDIAPGSWLWTTHPPSGDEGASIGFIPGEDMRPLIDLKDAFIIDIARVSRTPLSMFQLTGQVAAEGTLKQQETGLVSKAKDRFVTFGNAWEDAMIMARRLHNAFGEGGLDEDVTLSVQWDDPETRNEKEHLEGLLLKQSLGVPVEELWAEMGYDQEKIAEMRAMRGEEMQQSSNLGGELLRAFERGE